MLRYISMCSGIESASVAAHPLGWQPVAFSEIEPFPSAVLAHHYPAVPNLGDMTSVDWASYRGKADVVVAGTPCQAFSVAGARRGLADERGNLSLVFTRAVDAIDPQFVIWENVPGVLSSKDNAFGCFLAGLAGEDEALVAPGGKWTNAGYVLGPRRAVAWRILDAQYFGVAQRRRRVFVVASPRDGADPRAILFEFEGVRRDTAPRREARKDLAAGFARSVALRGREGGATAELGGDTAGCLRASSGGEDKPHVLAFGGNNTAGPIDVATALNACASASGRMDFESETFVAQCVDVCPTLRAGGNKTGGDRPPGTDVDTADSLIVQCVTGDVTHTLKAEGFDASEDGTGRGQPIINEAGLRVRRLTPTECEKLQGFAPGYTNVTYRGKPAADGPRYKALGNSKAVPVVSWLFLRIHQVAGNNG